MNYQENFEKHLKEQMVNEKRQHRCENCDRARAFTTAGVGTMRFLGCTHLPYKGKWVIEIEHCPLEEE